MMFPRDIRDRSGPTAPPKVIDKPLRVERVVSQKVELLLLDRATPPTLNSSDFYLQVDARITAGEVSHPPPLPVIPTLVEQTATATRSFFDLRRSGMTLAFGSPKTPTTVASGLKPGKRYASQSRFWR